MYKSIHIQNFRGLRDLRIDDLGRVNPIVGANNVGKTSLLEALWLLQSGGDPFDVARLASDRGLQPFDELVEIAVDSLVYGQQWIDWIRIEGRTTTGKRNKLAIGTGDGNGTWRDSDGTTETMYFARNVRRQYAARTAEVFRELVFRYMSNDEAINANGLPERLVVNPGDFRKHMERTDSVLFGPAVLLSALQRLDREEIAVRLTRVQDAGSKSDLLESLRAFDDRIEDVYVGLDRTPSAGSRALPVPRVKYRTLRDPLPLAMIGGGAGRLVDILVSIPLAHEGIVAIDEIENGIYHGNLTSAWRAIDAATASTATQVFATTHSWECVVAAVGAFRETPDDLKIHRLEREQGGENLRVITYDYELAQAAVTGFVEVR